MEGKERKQKGKPRVLIVEDDELALNMLRTNVRLRGDFDPNSVCVKSTSEALEISRRAKEEGKSFGLILSDLGLSDDKEGGFKLAKTAKKEGLASLFILYTGRSGDVALQYNPKQLEEMGINKLLGKPVSSGVIADTLAWAKTAITKPQPAS